MTTIGRKEERKQRNNVYQMQKTTKMKRLTRSTSSYKIFILAEICTATKWKYNKVHARFVCFDLNGPGWNGRGSHVSDIAIVIPGTWQHHFLSGVLIPPPPHFPLDLLCCPNSMLYFVFCFVLLFFLNPISFGCQSFQMNVRPLFWLCSTDECILSSSTICTACASWMPCTSVHTYIFYPWCTLMHR